MSVYDGPKLITNGLVFLFDAADKNSYRGTGTGCRDLITNTIGTLTNFPTQSFFSTANGGNIIFDGTDDYINFGSGFNQAGSWTVGAIAKTNTPTSVDVIIGRTSGDANYYQNYVVYFYNNKATVSTKTSEGYVTADTVTTIVQSKWYYVVGVYDSAFKSLSIYLNGVYESGSGIAQSPITIGAQYLTLGAGDGLNAANALNGNISLAHIYNIPLSAPEIMRNFKSLESRFGI